MLVKATDTGPATSQNVAKLKMVVEVGVQHEYSRNCFAGLVEPGRHSKPAICRDTAAILYSGELSDSTPGMLNPTIRQGRPHDLQTRQSQWVETPEKPQLRGFFRLSVYVSPSPNQGMWSQGNTLCICIEGVPEQNVTCLLYTSPSPRDRG